MKPCPAILSSLLNRMSLFAIGMLAVMFLSQGLSLLHVMTTSHAVSAISGNIVHVSENNDSQCAQPSVADNNHPILVSDTPSEDKDEICQIFAQLSNTFCFYCANHSDFKPNILPLSDVQAAVLEEIYLSLSPLRLAPKHSPPAPLCA